MSGEILNIQNLTVALRSEKGERTIVENFSLKIPAKKIVALVGGSGSGKTTTGLAVLGLLAPALTVTQGKIIFEGRDLLQLNPEDIRRVRGKEIAMIFQEPLYAFNPLFRIGKQINEVLVYHTAITPQQRQWKILELLAQAGINDPKRVAESFPHQLSGGMRQRAMIAQAIAASPKLIIADEPTSNLDVTLQARIMELFRKLRDEFGMTILLITHDLGVVAHLADEVAVLSKGAVVESGKTKEVLSHPKHPFTAQLMEAFQ